jgi:hypothetical protein
LPDPTRAGNLKVRWPYACFCVSTYVRWTASN